MELKCFSFYASVDRLYVCVIACVCMCARMGVCPHVHVVKPHQPSQLPPQLLGCVHSGGCGTSVQDPPHWKHKVVRTQVILSGILSHLTHIHAAVT